jgi:UDP-2,3-diacylglucosamine hydrolase
MRRASPRRIGILAGGQSLPMEIAESLRQRGALVHIVAIEGEASETLSGPDTTWVNWGQIGKIISSFKNAGCRQVVIAGGVRRPDLSTIKPDLGFFRAVPTVLRLIRVGGDDAILRGVIGYFERFGLEVVGVNQVAPELLVGAGDFAGPDHRQGDLGDARTGFEVLRALAPFDVGQAVVVARGSVEAIEGAEGTDRMLDRLIALRHNRMRQRQDVGQGILIKAPKPGQELRVDMPAIGPETIRKAAGADLRGIAVDAGRVLAIERSKLLDLAKAHRVFVAGVSGDQLASRTTEDGQPQPAFSVRQLGRRGLRDLDKADATKGAQVIEAMECFGAGRAVVVSARHVLAVEAGEGVLETLGRAAHLRQWGGGFGARRKGVAVMSVGRELDAAVIAQAAKAGLAGVGVVLQKFAASVGPEVVAEADRRKLFIAGLEREPS